MGNRGGGRERKRHEGRVVLSVGAAGRQQVNTLCFERVTFNQITSESLQSNRRLKARTYLDGTQQGDAVGAVLEVLITKRSPTKWEWRVCDRYGTTIMGGFERTRPAAKYRGNRALFLLLSTGCAR